MPHTALPLLAAILLTGCFSTEFDPSLSGVFACDNDDDCGEAQSCRLSLCFNDADIPTVEIVDPPLGTPIPLSQDGSLIEIPLTIRTNLSLVPRDEGAAVSVTEGFLQGELLGGGAANVLVEEGEDEVTLLFQLDPDQSPGPLKFAIQAFSPNGTEFPNEEAAARTVLFLDDGSPQVALVQPWPGQRFAPTSVSGVTFEVATLNFTMRPPQAAAEPGFGHVHIVQRNPEEEDPGNEFPRECLETELDCADQMDFYTAVFPSENSTLLEAPLTLNRAAGVDPMNHRVWAILATDIHSSVGFPADAPEVVIDSVELDRNPLN